MTLGLILLPIASVVFAQSRPHELVSWEEISKRPVPTATHRRSYGEGAVRFGDLRLPSGEGPFPVAVVIHGGCWRSENDLGHVSHLSDALSRAGVATWTIEYRRVGDAGGGWPGTFEDVAAGTDYVRTLSSQFPLDLNRAVLVGHSAGGHLALWVAARRSRSAGSRPPSEQPLSIRGVVALAAITDLRAFSVGSAYCNASVPALMGARATEVPDRYRQASPIELLPLGVAQRLLHGALDPLVPVEQSRAFADKARGLGEDVELIVLPDAGHFDLIAPWSRTWSTVEKTVRTLVGRR